MNGGPTESRIARVARAYLNAREEASKWRGAENEAFESLKVALHNHATPIVVDGIYIELGDEDALLTRPVEVVS